MCGTLQQCAQFILPANFDRAGHQHCGALGASSPCDGAQPAADRQTQICCQQEGQNAQAESKGHTPAKDDDQTRQPNMRGRGLTVRLACSRATCSRRSAHSPCRCSARSCASTSCRRRSSAWPDATWTRARSAPSCSVRADRAPRAASRSPAAASACSLASRTCRQDAGRGVHGCVLHTLAEASAPRIYRYRQACLSSAALCAPGPTSACAPDPAHLQGQAAGLLFR